MHQQLSASDIIAADRDIEVPFSLGVVTNKGIKRVTCRQILRLLPRNAPDANQVNYTFASFRGSRPCL
jgi:hypothetical protein